jgi:hypothetical protein
LVEKELDEKKWIGTMKLCAKYLWSKEFTENWEGLGGGYCETPNVHDITIDDFLKIVCENPINFYGQFITRVLMDMGTVIVPYQRFVQNKAMLNQMFSSFDKITFPEEWFLDWGVTPEAFPLIWALSKSLFGFS